MSCFPAPSPHLTMPAHQLLDSIAKYDDNRDMAYTGGKGNTYQNYINLIPPHTHFISAFAGHCAVAQNIKPAQVTTLIDADKEVLEHWTVVPKDRYTVFEVVYGDALEWLQKFKLLPTAFVYADPPYLFETRASERDLYRHELGTEAEHVRLIKILKSLDCMVMLCGYESALYADLLSEWHCETFTAYTRSHRQVTECIWMNYAEPSRLHDYSFLGDNFRERERIKRKASRWYNGLMRLPLLERQAILSELEPLFSSASPQMTMDTGAHRQK